MKIFGIDSIFICCDNSAEKIFHMEYRSNGCNSKLELSGSSTPQHNGKVEKKFQSFYERIRAK